MRALFILDNRPMALAPIAPERSALIAPIEPLLPEAWEVHRRKNFYSAYAGFAAGRRAMSGSTSEQSITTVTT
jgi:hypothetical protein